MPPGLSGYRECWPALVVSASQWACAELVADLNSRCLPEGSDRKLLGKRENETP